LNETIIRNPVWFARATIVLAASCGIGVLVSLGEDLIGDAPQAWPLGSRIYQFWVVTATIAAACGLRGGRQLLQTLDSRGDGRLVFYALLASIQYGYRSAPLRYTWTPGFNLEFTIAFDNLMLGVNVVGLLLFVWLLYLRGKEVDAASTSKSHVPDVSVRAEP
jgi:hypothetical protein